ncbi:MAG: heat shock protein Hsp20, family protein [Parcubacteria group bacterium]|nr:heat shock protein Hsp20, family protein [Parcubacteria group bacterium]
MPPKKRSFFDRLAGALPADDYDSFEDDVPTVPNVPARRVMPTQTSAPQPSAPVEQHYHEEEPAGQLPVDVYQTTNEIIIRAFVAGVRPDEMNVSISRDMVEIEGSREERDQVQGSDYFSQELFWGSFARTILLPQEVDVDASTASAKDGLLTIMLPRLDKTRQTKLRVKAG